METALTTKRKAIQPTSISTPGQEERLGDWSRGEGTFRDFRERNVHPSPLMRALGYTANPAVCDHIKKRYITKWVCADCGMDL